MKIQRTIDVHIKGTEALVAQVSATTEQALERFGEHVTPVEVHLGEQRRGSQVGGAHDEGLRGASHGPSTRWLRAHG